PVAAVAAATLIFGAASALPVGPAAASSSIEETRTAAQQAAQDHADAEAELGRLESDLERLRTRRDRAKAERDGLRGTVQSIAVDRYTVGERSLLLER